MNGLSGKVLRNQVSKYPRFQPFYHFYSYSGTRLRLFFTTYNLKVLHLQSVRKRSTVVEVEALSKAGGYLARVGNLTEGLGPTWQNIL